MDTKFNRNWRNLVLLEMASKWDLVFVLVCCIFIYLHVFLLPATPIFYEVDHLIFLHDAWRMYEGEVIYRDFFQFTFPGTQVLYLLLFHIFGLKYWTVSLVIFFQAIGQTVVSLAISKHIFGPNSWYAYLPPSLFLFFGFRWFGIDGSHRFLSSVFVYLAILVLLGSRSNRRVLLAGVFCALSSFFTQNRGLFALAGISLFLIYEAIKNKQEIRKVLISEAVLLSSFSITITILILPFVVLAGVETFFNYTVFFIRNYLQDPSANYSTYFLDIKKFLDQGFLISVVAFFYYLLIPLVYLVALFWLWIWKKDQSDRSKILLTLLVGLFLALGTFGPNPSRLLQVSIPALTVFVWLISQFRMKYTPILAINALIVFGFLLAIRLQTNWHPEILQTRTGEVAFLSPVALERYKWIAENAKEDEYVFEVYQCSVNFLFQLRNPTQVPFLLNTGYTPTWQVEQSIQNLEQKKPRFIIWDGVWTEQLKTIEEGENLKPLYDYLQKRYELKVTFTPYDNRQMQVWERKQ